MSDPDGQIRNLLARCGLDFEPECIEFHKTERIVRTASAGQVRKPVYTVRHWNVATFRAVCALAGGNRGLIAISFAD
ncbi:hypothetical protein [Oricola cellulosilytica]|uniref:Uncharacterized protein n=1 Tax=Oricola cellulosilytica TaxID=1429082 RepID=A0A4R0PB59_9HYPH|nr:hypothetical protein [Oricola cellulosilytica]TCD14286.1 hypothetical protein E0D97_09410 [Oricola cellulosilytica]